MPDHAAGSGGGRLEVTTLGPSCDRGSVSVVVELRPAIGTRTGLGTLGARGPSGSPGIWVQLPAGGQELRRQPWRSGPAAGGPYIC